jgi:predicted metal-binding protein
MMSVNTKMSSTQSEMSLKFLQNAANDAGAHDAVLIPVSDIIFEERIILKCKTGCPSYGRSLSCPPHVPDIAAFRRMINEYQHALLIRFKSTISPDTNIIHSLMKNRFDPGVSPELKERTQQFEADLEEENRRIHMIMLEMEKTAFQAGYPFALALTTDSCNLCKTCNVKGGICIHPSQMRYPLEAAGINVIETSRLAGIPIQFPCPIPPDRITLLLIS